MNEQFPEAVHNNYQVNQSDKSDLLIAESRAYNSYQDNPHPLVEAQKPKTHGLSYRETELAGKPFTIAETYPGSRADGQADNKENTPKDSADTSDDSKPKPKPKFFDPSAPNNTYHNSAAHHKKEEATDEDEDNSDSSTTKKMPIYEAPKFEDSKDPDQIRQEKLTQEFLDARDEFARLSAGRGRRSFTTSIKGKEFNKKLLTEARENYEKASKELVKQEVLLAKKAGIDPNELKKAASAGEAENKYSLTTSIYEHRMVATGRGQYNDVSGEFEMKKPKTPFGRAANSFYDWWGKQDGKKGMLKKAGAAAGIGFAVGVPTAFAGTLLLGPVAGGAVGVAAANRLAKSWMVSKVSERSRDRYYAEDLEDNLQAEIINPTYPRFGKAVEVQTNNEVKRNRKRMIKIAGLAAIGGFGGELLGQSLGLDHVIGSGHSHAAHSASSHPSHHPAHHKAKGDSRQSHNHKTGENSKLNVKPTVSENPTHSINGNQFNGEYVSTVYEHQLGLHHGFNNMEHAARMAEHAHALRLISDPSNAGHFFYETASGHEDTDSVLKVLAKYGGKVKVR